MTSVPLISITTPELESSEYISSETTTPDSPTVFDVVNEFENSSKLPPIDEALDLTAHPILQQDEQRPNTVKGYYYGKSVLITGATGFIGKAILWKLVQSLFDSIDKIIVLLRSNKCHSPHQRLQQDILLNKVYMKTSVTLIIIY